MNNVRRGRQHGGGVRDGASTNCDGRYVDHFTTTGGRCVGPEDRLAGGHDPRIAFVGGGWVRRLAPAIAVSITVSCVSLVALRSLRRWSGTAAGVVAALIGMAVTAAVTVVLIAWRN
jgi:phage tail tape-measure protein